MNKAEKIFDRYVLSRFFRFESTRKAANNTAWLLFDKCIRIILGLTVNVGVARYLGPEQFGELSYVISLTSFVIPITTFSLESLVVRDLVKKEYTHNQVLGSAFIIRLVGGVIGFLVNLAMILTLKSGITDLLIMTIFLSLPFFTQPLDLTDQYFQSVLKSKYSIYVRTSLFVVVNLSKLLLVYYKAPLYFFAAIIFVEFVSGTVGLVIFYVIRGNNPFRWKMDGTLVNIYIKSGIPLVLQGVAMMVQARIDQVLIGNFLDDRQLGEYSVAIRLIEFFAFIPGVVYTSAAPIIAEAKGKSEELYKSKLTDLYRLMFLLWLLTAIPILLFGHWTVETLYGKQFSVAGSIFALSAFRLFFTNIGTAKAVYFINENLFRYSLVTVLIGCASNIVLNFILIPVFGVWGAFTATISSYIISIFVCDLFLDKTRSNLRIIFNSFAFWRGLTSIKFKR